MVSHVQPNEIYPIERLITESITQDDEKNIYDLDLATMLGPFNINEHTGTGMRCEITGITCATQCACPTQPRRC